MAKDPAVLFYTSDFLTGTMTMTNEEVGKYIRLLCLQHQKGRLTEQDMLFICSTYVENVFNKFKKNGDGRYYNERLEQESIKRKAYSESRRKNISKRYDSTYVVHMENENENINEDIIINENRFNEFWDLYDKKVGKPNTIKQWKKLKPEETEKIFIHLPKYKQANEKQFRKDPERYLKHKTFNDEIIEEVIKTIKGTSRVVEDYKKTREMLGKLNTPINEIWKPELK